jgi:Dolichyl-phosphate-mannose-protein mannosyltransferase
MLALLFCVLVARPFVSMGVIDDWSYIWTARVLANTGHLTYNGWATAMLGWQVYLGALFIKLFGFSFTVVRFSVLVLSLLCAALMQRCFVRSGASEGTASIATLTLVLSPLFLPEEWIFMTDIPSLFVLVLCIYSCLRVVQTASDKAALGWLIFAGLSNLVGGTVRQVAWLGVFVIVPSTAWLMRRRRHMLPVGAALWVISILGSALYLRWFYVQPYAVIDKVLYTYHLNFIFNAVDATLLPLACLLPVMCAFIVKSPIGNRRARNIAAITGAIVAALLFWWAMTSPHGYFRTAPFGVDGNTVSIKGQGRGEIIGNAPDVIPVVVQFLLVVAMFSALFSFFACLIGARNTLLTADSRAAKDQGPYPYISNVYLVTLFLPFVVIYAFLIGTRALIWDRYFLPLQFIFTLALIRIYRQTISERLPRLSLIVGLLFCFYGVASLHDFFAFQRARLDATKEIIATGVPRTAISAGHEYDSWTQLEQTGYVNDPHIVPVGAYHAWVPPDLPFTCIGWFRRLTPSVHPLLYLSHNADNCYKPSQFAPVIYENWLPPRRRTIYILENR